MNEIILMLKQVGIFMVCAQTIIHFKPKEKYDRYLKLLVGIMVMVMLVSPVLEGVGSKKKMCQSIDMSSSITGEMIDMDNLLGEADQIRDRYTDTEIKSRLNYQKEWESGEEEIEIIEIPEVHIQRVKGVK